MGKRLGIKGERDWLRKGRGDGLGERENGGMRKGRGTVLGKGNGDKVRVVLGEKGEEMDEEEDWSGRGEGLN